MTLQSKDIGKNIGKRDILEKPYKFYTLYHYIQGPSSTAHYSDYRPSHTDTCAHTCGSTLKGHQFPPSAQQNRHTFLHDYPQLYLYPRKPPAR